jgi:hypothetical protein
MGPSLNKDSYLFTIMTTMTMAATVSRSLLLAALV